MRVQMQQQLYERFCRLCRGPFSGDKYNLYRAWSLTKTGTLLSSITGEDLSLEAECAPQICMSCYNRLDTIAKKENELQRKHQLLVLEKEDVCNSLRTGRRFFTEGKLCRIPISPRIAQSSPSTSSPARKRLASTRHLQIPRCARSLAAELSACAQSIHNMASPMLQCTDKGTQTTATVSHSQPPKKDMPVPADAMV